jgi:phage FluMu gp28-like protein
MASVPTSQLSTEAFRQYLRILPRYQRQWVLEPSRFAVVNKARQVGFSFATALAAVLGGLYEKRTQLVLSASQPLSDEVLAKVKGHCRQLALLGHRGALDLAVDNRNEIAWSSGGRVISLPANPRTARSFSGDVYLDEAAYFEDPEGIRDAILPMVTRGNFRFRAISTPNGAQGLFYEWVTQPGRGWAVRTVSIDDAIRDGFQVDRDELFHTVAGGDERLFGQWFGCQFLDADLQYFPTALVTRSREWVGVPDLRNARVFAGLDVGRDHDLTALTIVAVRDGVAWVVKTLTCKRTDFRSQKAMIRDARTAFKWDKLHIDQTGIGRQLAEELAEEFGRYEAVPVTFTNQIKADLVTRTLRWFRDEKVRLPHGAEGDQLAAETIACRRQVTTAGNVTYDIPRTGKGHGDRFWSLTLALWGAGEPELPRGLGQAPLMAIA